MNLQSMILEWNLEASKLHFDRLQTGPKAAVLPERLTTPLKYACPVCKELYDKEIDAMICRDQLYETAGLKEGDIMVIPNSRFYEPPKAGFEHWLAFHLPADPEASSHFDHSGQWYPYYVVTAIHPEQRDPHRCVVTVMTAFRGSLDGGWNPATGWGHNAMFHPGRSREFQRSDEGSLWWTMERNGVKFSDRIQGLSVSNKLLEQAQQLAKLRISTRNLL